MVISPIKTKSDNRYQTETLAVTITDPFRSRRNENLSSVGTSSFRCNLRQYALLGLGVTIHNTLCWGSRTDKESFRHRNQGTILMPTLNLTLIMHRSCGTGIAMF